MRDDGVIEEVRGLIGDLLSHACGFEVFAVTANEPRLKLMELSETGIEGGLKGELKNAFLEIIRSSYYSDEAEYALEDDIADNQNKFYIIKQNEGYRPFDFICQGSESFTEEHINEIQGFVFDFRYETQHIYCYQKGRNLTVPNRTRHSFLTRITNLEKGLVLEKQTESLVTISKAIDALIINDYIITHDLKMMERSFDFSKFIGRKAHMAAKRIGESNLFECNKLLDLYLKRDGSRQKTFFRKMMKTMDSPVLEMSAEELFNRISTSERWKGVFRKPVNNKIPIVSIGDVENLIDLLNERFTKSEITGLEYDTDVKKKASAK